MKRFTDPFNGFTNLMRNLGWWLGIGIACGSTVVTFVKTTQAQITALSVVVGIGAVYACIRAYVYRRRNKRLRYGSRYIHSLLHDLQESYSKEIGKNSFNSVYTETSSEFRPIDVGNLGERLVQILDNAALCFREMTGEACTTSLIMPCYSASEGYYFKSVLYCSDVDPRRKKGVMPQKGGLTWKAIKDDGPVYFPDYERELRMGTFVIHREDVFKWAKSGYMCPFIVNGEKWGLLNIDSPKKNAFRLSHSELVAAFADACGLAMTIDELLESRSPNPNPKSKKYKHLSHE